MGDEVVIDWDIGNPGGIVQYAIFRDSNFIDSAATNSYTDSNANPSRSQICYQISYLDQCGNSSELSLNSCPVFPKRTTQNKTMLDLGWSAYQGWNLGVREYFVEKYDQDGNLINTTSVGTLQAFQEPIDQSQPQSLFYRIRAESDDQPALISFSNLLEVDLAAEVFLPNAFYPDGVNNLFTVNSIFVTEYQLRIFNRWGELVHVSNQNGSGWDGTYSQTGKRAPMGTYIYNIEFTDTRNNTITQSGPVLLIR